MFGGVSLYKLERGLYSVGGGGGVISGRIFLVHVKRPITKGAGAYTRTFTTLV